MTDEERIRQLMGRIKRLEAMDIHLAGFQRRIHRLIQAAEDEFVRVRHRYYQQREAAGLGEHGQKGGQ